MRVRISKEFHLYSPEDSEAERDVWVVDRVGDRETELEADCGAIVMVCWLAVCLIEAVLMLW